MFNYHLSNTLTAFKSLFPYLVALVALFELHFISASLKSIAHEARNCNRIKLLNQNESHQ